MPYTPQRIPLIEPLESRDLTLAFDRKMVNCIAEQSSDGSLRAIKRPGNHLAFTGQVGTGQGVTNYLNNLYSISGDFLNSFSGGGGGGNLVATQATASTSWQGREGMATVGFSGRLWVIGGFMSPALAAPSFTASVSGGAVVGIAINSAGLGYSPGYPTTLNLIFSGGGGSNAAATVTVTGQSVSAINITNPGTGYTTSPSVSIATTGWGVMNDVWSSVDGVSWTQVTSQAAFPQRGRAEAIVFNGAMYLTGGTTGTGANALDKAYGDVWMSTDGITWTRTTANAFPPRYRHGLTVFNGNLWVAGGAGLIVPSNPQYPNTFYSDVYFSPDGISWVKTVGQAPWVARANHAFFPANNLLWVVGGRLTDAFSTATGDSWSSPDGITWTRASSNPFGVAASAVWPVAAFQSYGMDYPIPPTVTVNSAGTGGSGAAAWAFSDFDDDGDDDDLQVGPLVQTTFSNVGSGYNTAPTISFGTDVGFNAQAYALLNGTSNGGAKMFRTGQIGSTIYLFEFADGGTYVHTIWTTTDGVHYTNLNVNFTAGWVPRSGEWITFGNLWMLGGIDSTPTYYSDVWYIVIAGAGQALNPQVPLGFYHFNQTSTAITTPLLVFKSTADLYTYNAALAVLTKLSTAANYPTTTVPGLAYLDGTFYVMDPKGQIWNSGLNDPSTWTALGVIAMQNEPNGGMAIAKLSTFVVGFGVWTTEFFYDNANPAPASPLAPNTQLPINVGCAAGESVVEMENTIVWIGQTRHEAQGIYWLNGYNAERISTPYIDRLIQNDTLAYVRAYSINFLGHPHYVLFLGASNLTLAFDFTTRIWSPLTSLTARSSIAVQSLSCDPYGTVTASAPSHGFSDGDPVIISNASTIGYNGLFSINYINNNTFSYYTGTALAANAGTAIAQGYNSAAFSPVASAEVLGIDYVQDPTNGAIYAQVLTDNTDHGNPVDLQLLTQRWDGGASTYKFIQRTSLVADIVNSYAFLCYSDNDYQTFSSFRPVNLAISQRPGVTPCGRSRRRVWKVRHIAPTPFRAEGIEVELYLGDS